MEPKEDLIPAILPEVIEIPGKPFKMMSFPDGFRCYSHSSDKETAYIHRELIQEMCYLQNGIDFSLETLFLMSVVIWGFSLLHYPENLKT